MKVKILKSHTLENIEFQINDYISGKDVKDIKLEVVKNFLPQTNMGEFEEVYYAMIMED